MLYKQHNPSTNHSVTMRFLQQWVPTSHCIRVWCSEVQKSVTNVLEEPGMCFQVKSRRDSFTLNMEAARSSETLVPLWLLCLTPQKSVISTLLCSTNNWETDSNATIKVPLLKFGYHFNFTSPIIQECMHV